MADNAKLVATIEARTVQFERALKRIEQQTDRAFRGGAGNVVRFQRGLDQSAVSATRLDRALARVNANQGRLTGFARSFGSGLLAGAGAGALLSFGAALQKARDALADFDNIAKQARITGLTPELFQALSFAAVETGVSQEKLNASLAIFARNSGLAEEGTGALATALKRLNPELLKQLQTAQTQDQRLRLIATAMGQAATAADRAALSAAAFGRGGVELTEIFGAGAAGLDDFMRRARELGLIIDRSLLEKADELDDKLAVLSKTIDLNLNVALVELAPLLLAAAKAAAALAKEIGDTVAATKEEGLTGFMREQGAADWEVNAVKALEGFLFSVKELREEAEAAIPKITQLQALMRQGQSKTGWLLDRIAEGPHNRDRFTDEQIRKITELHRALGEGTPDAVERAQRALDDLYASDEGFARMVEQLQPLIDGMAELFGITDEVVKKIGEIGAGGTVFSASDMVRANQAATQSFLSDTEAEARKTEFQRDVDAEAAKILEGAKDLGIVMSEAAARIQAEINIRARQDAAGIGGAISDYVQEVIKAESGGDRTAKNPDSSATGLGQFITETWVRLFKQEFPDRAKGLSDAAIAALRTDAEYSKALIEAYARENAEVLQAAGVSVDKAALHLAHFLGAGDAAKVLTAAPGTPLQGLIQQSSINANPTILGGGRTVDDAIAYARGRASMTEADQKHTASLNDLVLAAEREIEALNLQAETFGASTFEVEKARFAHELLAQAMAAGLEITPELRAKIEELSTAYANGARSLEEMDIAAQSAEEAQERLKERMDGFRDAASDVLGGFIRDMQRGKSAAEALSDALANIANKLLDIGLNALFGGAGGGGGFGGFLSAIFGGIFGGGKVGAKGFHSGGVVGLDGTPRMVAAAAFAGAPRFHNGGIAGLRAGEVPAILKAGEIVLPRMPTAGARPSNETITVALAVPKEMMSQIADQRIMTKAGTLVRIAVTESRKAGRADFAGNLRMAQVREL